MESGVGGIEFKDTPECHSLLKECKKQLDKITLRFDDSQGTNDHLEESIKNSKELNSFLDNFYNSGKAIELANKCSSSKLSFLKLTEQQLTKKLYYELDPNDILIDSMALAVKSLIYSSAPALAGVWDNGGEALFKGVFHIIADLLYGIKLSRNGIEKKDVEKRIQKKIEKHINEKICKEIDNLLETVLKKALE